MTQQELNAIKARYNEQDSTFRNVGKCTLKDINVLIAEVERLHGVILIHKGSCDILLDKRNSLIAELERLRDVQWWIPVTERLPNETDTDDNRDSCVLAIHKKIDQCYFNWNTVVNNPFDFTRWMPLPEPPTEMKDDDFCSYGERKED